MRSKPQDSTDHPVQVVHLRRAEIDDPAVRQHWQDRGYATLGPVEGHDPHQRCPICSTDKPPEPPKKGCPYCGEGPCRLGELLRAYKDS
jgi:hypothetical protein